MKNITLSADEKLINAARDYARAHQTTLNELIRDYLRRISGRLEPADAAREFAELARRRAGRSQDEGPLDREAIHQRREIL